jgi:hypothetical protein
MDNLDETAGGYVARGNDELEFSIDIERQEPGGGRLDQLRVVKRTGLA